MVYGQNYIFKPIENAETIGKNYKLAQELFKGHKLLSGGSIWMKKDKEKKKKPFEILWTAPRLLDHKNTLKNMDQPNRKVRN